MKSNRGGSRSARSREKNLGKDGGDGWLKLRQLGADSLDLTPRRLKKFVPGLIRLKTGARDIRYRLLCRIEQVPSEKGQDRGILIIQSLP